jgi:predicted nuclease with TOPRIM domain
LIGENETLTDEIHKLSDEVDDTDGRIKSIIDENNSLKGILRVKDE